MLPPVSLPIANPTSPAAVAAPGPALEPDDPSSSSQGIHGLAAEPNVVERQCAEAQLRDEHRACLIQTPDHGGVLGGHAVSEGLGAVGGSNTGGVEKVLAAPGDPVQGSAVFAGGDLLVRLSWPVSGPIPASK